MAGTGRAGRTRPRRVSASNIPALPAVGFWFRGVFSPPPPIHRARRAHSCPPLRHARLVVVMLVVRLYQLAGSQSGEAATLIVSAVPRLRNGLPPSRGLSAVLLHHRGRAGVGHASGSPPRRHGPVLGPPRRVR